MLPSLRIVTMVFSPMHIKVTQAKIDFLDEIFKKSSSLKPQGLEL